MSKNGTTEQAPATQVREPGDTSKSKRSLGIPEDHVVTWVPFNLPYEDSNVLKAVARKRDVKAHLLCRDVMSAWFEANREELTKEADEFLKASEKSAEDLAKELTAMQAKMARLQSMLEAKSKG